MSEIWDLDKLRNQTDTAADELIAWVMENGEHAQMSMLMALESNDEEIPKEIDPKLKSFILHCSELPSWADQKLIDQAEDFFQEYQVYVYTALLFASLPYCYAAADGARVLFSSKRIQETTGKRLSETGQFIMDVSEKGAFSAKGKAFKSIAKVRLIHAAVRYNLLKKGDWKESWGKPTNMEDMAGTNLAFSVVTLRAIERMGVEIPLSIRDAVMHKWNCIAYLLGLDEALLPPNYTQALLLEKQIVRRQFRKSEEGVALTKSLLNFIHSIEKPLAPDYGSHMIRFLLGNQSGDLLGLAENPLINWPSLMSSANAVIHSFGWSPKLDKMHIPLHLALIKRGEVQNERMNYPLDSILNPK